MKRHLTQADILSIGQPQQLQGGEAIHLETQFLKLSPEVAQELIRQMGPEGQLPKGALDFIGIPMSESHGDPRIGEEIPQELMERLAALKKAPRDWCQSINQQYHDWLYKISRQGELRADRTGTGTLSLFGEVQMRADLRVEFPTITTKYVHFPAVDDELDWMKSGSQNIRSMKKNGTRIWDEWVKDGTHEYRTLSIIERMHKLNDADGKDLCQVVRYMREDHRSLDHIESVQHTHCDNAGIPRKTLIAGELGPVYGTQWRFWDDTRIITAAEWARDPEGWQARGYTVAGKMFDGWRIAITRKIDQIAVIEQQLKDELAFQRGEIEKHSAGRRIILSGWNVAQLDEMALPPCHAFAQWYVSSETDTSGKHFLDCEMYQRSGDMFLGVPFNMAQYSLFTAQLAHVHGLRARYFTHTIGDAHIYTNHVEQVTEQLKRDVHKYAHPQLEITGEFNSILEMKTGDCKLVGYQYYPAIKAKVAV